MAEFSLPKNSKVQQGKDFPYKGSLKIKKSLIFTDGHLMMMIIQE